MSTKVTAIEREEHATNQLFLLVVASAAAHVTWMVTTSVLAYAIGVPFYGRVSDYYASMGVFQSTANREEV